MKTSAGLLIEETDFSIGGYSRNGAPLVIVAVRKTINNKAVFYRIPRYWVCGDDCAVS